MEPEVNPVSLLPTRPRGAYANKFRNVDIASNHYEVTLKDIPKIVVFDYTISPKVELANEAKLN